MKSPAIAALTLCCLPAAVSAQSLFGQSKPETINRLAPSVASPQNVVEEMLKAADVKPNDMVYDLGSGDGRVVITAAKEFGARAVGVEIMHEEAEKSRDKIKEARLDQRVRIIEGDMLTVDLSEADVVTLYLLTSSNDLVRPHLEKFLKRGARVVSHDYPVRGWEPKEVKEVEATRRVHHLYVYEMPPTPQQ